jgi:hypothetical protein
MPPRSALNEERPGRIGLRAAAVLAVLVGQARQETNGNVLNAANDRRRAVPVGASVGEQERLVRVPGVVGLADPADPRRMRVLACPTGCSFRSSANAPAGATRTDKAAAAAATRTFMSDPSVELTRGKVARFAGSRERPWPLLPLRSGAERARIAWGGRETAMTVVPPTTTAMKNATARRGTAFSFVLVG